MNGAHDEGMGDRIGGDGRAMKGSEAGRGRC